MSTQVFYVDTRWGAPRLKSYTIFLVAAVLRQTRRAAGSGPWRSAG